MNCNYFNPTIADRQKASAQGHVWRRTVAHERSDCWPAAFQRAALCHWFSIFIFRLRARTLEFGAHSSGLTLNACGAQISGAGGPAAWMASETERARSSRCPMSAPYASPAIRDEFLTALDTHDRQLSTQLAMKLTGCTNPLPSTTCDMLGLPIGSTYGSAATQVLFLYSVARQRRSGPTGL